jgi:hypothetical protein
MKVIPEKVVNLEGSEVNELKQQIKNHPGYKDIVTSMQQIKKFEESDAKVQLAARFELSQKSGSTSKEVIILSFNTEDDVLLSYSENKLEGAVNVEGKLLRFSTKPLEVEVTSTTLKGSLETDFSVPSGQVESQAINFFAGEGCFPSPLGHYEHCGKNCGYYGDLGGGTPKNALDRCCVAHDRCWRQFGDHDPECDRIFVDCASDHYWTNPALVEIIQWYFG